MGKQHLFIEGDTHLVGVWVFSVVLKEVVHGPLITSVRSATLTIQVQGILIKSALIHNSKGH